MVVISLFFIKVSKIREQKKIKKKGGYSVSKDKLTPSSQVDQKKLLNDKVEESRKNNFEDDHVRRGTPNGAQGQ
ncbi:MAG: hypothetical protein K0S34_1914 [Bacillales bacterium]|nr:hypothetical protein [Bacillales bacterium]